MKKRLLMQLLAIVVCVGASAQSYMFTDDAKYKLSGTNLITNGDFANGLDGWTNDINGALGSMWTTAAGQGPNGENAIQSASNEEGVAMVIAQVPSGTYVVSYQAKATAEFTASVAAGGANFVAFFGNADGSVTPDKAYGVSTANKITTEWATYNDTIQVVQEDGAYIVFALNKVQAGTLFTNIAVYKAEQVYDTRILEREIAFAEKLANDANFNTEDAAGDREDMLYFIEALKEQIENNELDTEGADNEAALKESLNTYLDATTEDLINTADGATYFQYAKDLTGFPKYNRGNIANGQQLGGFKFYGDNWLHGQGAEMLTKQIQGTSFVNGPGTVTLVNNKMPAGKYFIAADMRNADCDNSYNLTFNVESPIKGVMGKDSVALGTIVGKDYQRYYFIAELKEGEDFEAGFYWDNQDPNGSTFHIKNFQVRTFQEGTADHVAHLTAWATFKTQWDAAVSNRNKVKATVGDTNYPWGQDSLTAARTQWDPYFNYVREQGWINADGEDAGVATTDELNEWAATQGYKLDELTEESTPEDSLNYSRYSKYAVVRGYQYAFNYVAALNKPFTDLAEAIDAAKAERNKGTNATGNRDTFKAAIEKAIATIQSIRSTTTDATREADTEKLTQALDELKAAQEAFLASVQGTVTLADIDFSTPVVKSEVVDTETQATETIYTLNGTVGAMVIKGEAGFNSEDNKDGLGYDIGYGDNEAVAGMLRIGNVEAVVDFAGVGSGDVVTASFDIHYAQLQNKKYDFAFRNADNEHVAGFSYQVNGNWSLTTSPNELNIDGSKINRAGKGGSTDNATIITGANAPGVTHFEVVFDYGKKTITTTVTNKNSDSPYVSTNTEVLGEEGKNTIIAKFVLSSNCNNAARRSWFDNLKITQQTSHDDFEEEITDTPWGEATAIKAIEAPKTGVIYNLRGIRVANASQRGIYIRDGKKFVVK